MASSLSLPTHSAVLLPCKKKFRASRSLTASRTHCFKDEGKSSSVVDANLGVLRERIEEVKMKERLERCCVGEHGWNYVPNYTSCRPKREEEVAQFFQLMGLIGGTFGLTIFSGTFSLCIFSLLVHLSS